MRSDLTSYGDRRISALVDDYLARAVYAALFVGLFPALCFLFVKLLYPAGFAIGRLVRLISAKKPASTRADSWPE